MEKICNKCKVAKPLDYFSNDRSKKDGKRSICKPCSNKAQNDRYVPKPKDDSFDLTTLSLNGESVKAKRCRGCKIVKPLTDYYPHKSCLGGVNSRCKECEGYKMLYTQAKITSLIVDGVTVEAKKCQSCEEEKPLSCFSKINNSSRKGVGGHYANCRDCERKYRQELEESDEERKNKRLKRVRIYEKTYRNRRKELYAVNIDKNRFRGKVKDANRWAKKTKLRNDLTKDEYKQVVSFFNNECALTGTTEDLTMDHFIPLWTGHGGTYVGNVYPVTGSLNYSKQHTSPFDWHDRDDIKENIGTDRWERLISYLANSNEMPKDEFINYVEWCFDNRREKDEINSDNYDSVLEFRKSMKIVRQPETGI